MNNETLEVEVIAKRPVAVASYQAYIFGNTNNSGIGIPTYIVASLAWYTLLPFMPLPFKVKVTMLVLATILETVIVYGMRIRGGIFGALAIMKYSITSSKRKTVRN